MGLDIDTGTIQYKRDDGKNLEVGFRIDKRFRQFCQVAGDWQVIQDDVGSIIRGLVPRRFRVIAAETKIVPGSVQKLTLDVIVSKPEQVSYLSTLLGPGVSLPTDEGMNYKVIGVLYEGERYLGSYTKGRAADFT